MKRILSLMFLVCSLNATQKIPVELTEPRKVLGFYQLMKDMHEICEAYDLTYWIDSGTLLGAVRHKGLIPWDNDLDVCMFEKDTRKLISLTSLLKKLGYRVVNMPFGWTIKGRGCCFDIFLMKKKKGRYIYADYNTSTYFATRDKGPVYYTEDELFPLKLYTFGSLEVWGPNDPIPYLDVYYKNWQSTGKFLIEHETNTYSPKKIKLTKEHLYPAQPLGPLVDRVVPLIDKD